MDDKKTRTDSPGLNESWQEDRASLRHLMASKQADAGNNGDEEEKISVSKSHHFSLPYPRSAIPTRHKETDGQYNSYTEGNFHGTHRNEREKDDKLGQDTAEPQPEAKKKRKLNYLSESARVDIVDRIERGERQSDLAKEFGVTRAAICYLNKNRDGIRSKCWRAAAEKTNSSYTRSESATEILPHRVNKFHLHGNSERGSPSSLKSYERLGPQRVIGPLRHHHKYRVYEIKTLPMLMHFSMMRSKMRNPVSFRHAANRATRILLEEAFAISAAEHELESWSGLRFAGIVSHRNICGISLGDGAYCMLETFKSLEPALPTGFIPDSAIQEKYDRHTNTMTNMWLPANLRSFQNIFLLVPTCGSARSVYIAVQLLKEHGIRQESIVLVTLLASAHAVDTLCADLPYIQLLTGAIDPEVNDKGDILPGFGNFTERYNQAYHITNMDEYRLESRHVQRIEDHDHHSSYVGNSTNELDRTALRLELQRRQMALENNTIGLRNPSHLGR